MRRNYLPENYGFWNFFFLALLSSELGGLLCAFIFGASQNDIQIQATVVATSALILLLIDPR